MTRAKLINLGHDPQTAPWKLRNDDDDADEDDQHIIDIFIYLEIGPLKLEIIDSQHIHIQCKA